MRSPFDGKAIWFLTGSQDMYGPETLAQVTAQSQEIANALDKDADLPLAVEWRPVLVDSESILRTIHAANADPDCVGLIAWMHTFSPAKMWIRGLDVLARPLLHLHTQANESLPWSTIDMDFMNLNQSAHGDREFGHIQTRVGVRRTTVVGHVNQADVRARVGRWMRAAAGVDALRGLKLARFGDNMRGVAVTEGDKVEAELHFGVSIDAYGVNDLVDAVAAVAESAVDELVGLYLQAFEVAPSLRPGGEDAAALRYAARQEAGLRSFLEAGDFAAFTTNFEDLGALEQLPGLAVQRLMADGYGFGGEGDWKTAALLRAMKVMASGLPGGTSFMEDYTYHFGPGPQRVLGAHMLEVCPTLTTARPTLEIHPLSIGNRRDPVRLRFTADPGPGIVVGISDAGARFRFTANEVNLVEPDEPLRRMPVACAVWEPKPSLPVSAACWLQAGGPHHTVLSTAIDAETVEMFAELTQTELALIDASTTHRGFTNELRWNDVYYTLAARR